MVSHVTHRQKSWLVAHPETILTSKQIEYLEVKLHQLLRGVPLPYLIHRQSFYCLDFYVTPDVLIPRPETELLVEEAINWLYANPNRRMAADIGTGSGCIAISIANEIPDINFIATDVSLPALQVAKRNCISHQLDHLIHLIQIDLLNGLKIPFDLICVNLPYIPSFKLKKLAVSRHEPVLALDGGSNGLTHNYRLMKAVSQWLAPQGLLLLEIEYQQATNIMRLAKKFFPSAKVEILSDLAGLPRLLRVQI